jgi:hypothetical protein
LIDELDATMVRVIGIKYEDRVRLLCRVLRVGKLQPSLDEIKLGAVLAGLKPPILIRLARYKKNDHYVTTLFIRQFCATNNEIGKRIKALYVIRRIAENGALAINDGLRILGLKRAFFRAVSLAKGVLLGSGRIEIEFVSIIEHIEQPFWRAVFARFATLQNHLAHIVSVSAQSNCPWQ